MTNKYCLCLSTYVSAFGFVGFILFIWSSSFGFTFWNPTKKDTCFHPISGQFRLKSIEWSPAAASPPIGFPWRGAVPRWKQTCLHPSPSLSSPTSPVDRWDSPANSWDIWDQSNLNVFFLIVCYSFIDQTIPNFAAISRLYRWPEDFATERCVQRWKTWRLRIGQDRHGRRSKDDIQKIPAAKKEHHLAQRSKLLLLMHFWKAKQVKFSMWKAWNVASSLSN